MYKRQVCKKRDQEWDMTQTRIEHGSLGPWSKCATSLMCKRLYFVLLFQYREDDDPTHIISVGRCCDGGSAFEQKDDEHYDQVLWEDES